MAAPPLVPDTARHETVREELGRILAHPLFRNSRRYPNLLRHIVERTLEGRSGELKERTLGIEVFGRPPDYDTNLDPIVRISACEIRKRIAQFYHDENRQAAVRIELPLGSYVAEFHTASAPSPSPALFPAPAAAPIPTQVPSRRRLLILAGCAALVLVAASLAWRQPWRSESALDRFWSPVTGANGAVSLCLGQPTLVGSLSPTAVTRPVVAFPDVTALSNLIGWLSAHGKRCVVRSGAVTTLADLRAGPAVLVGAFNNDWTMRLKDRLRFTFEITSTGRYIRDAQSPTRTWGDPAAQPVPSLERDYALISRVQDPLTGQIVVTAAGLHAYGTVAASEFLSDSRYMQAVAAGAPAGWWHKNVQIVIEARVIGGSSAPPVLLAAHFW